MTNSHRKPFIAGITILALTTLPAVIHDTFFLGVLTESIMWIGLAIAWDVLAGYTGYLNFGQKIAQGKPEDVAKDPAVVEAYLGGEVR